MWRRLAIRTLYFASTLTRRIDVHASVMRQIKPCTGAGGLIRKQSRHLRVGSEWVTIWGQLPLSSNTKRSVDSAINFALAENHESVGTGGVLLAMLTADETTTNLIRTLGIDYCRFEKDLGRYLYRLMVESPGQELQLDSHDSTDS